MLRAVESISNFECRMGDNAPARVDTPFDIRHSSSEQWLLWQLADSAFPTGGFAHSAGLEAAWQHGEIRNRKELVSFVEANLQQLGRALLPLVLGAHAEPERLDEFDSLCDAFTTNHVANRSSRAQGKAFLVAVQRIFGNRASAENNPEKFSRTEVRAPFLHLAPVFGSVLARLGVSRETTARLFFFNHVRSILAAAVRLNIIGPMEAQSLQYQLTPKAESIIARCELLALDDIAQTSPLLELWQGSQDRLYSRLFQS